MLEARESLRSPRKGGHMTHKKLLLIGIIMAVLCVMTVGAVGSAAWFTDQEMVVGNSLAAGKLDIKINAESGTTLPISVANMEPGVWYGPYTIAIYNQNTPLSTMPCKYRFYDAMGSESVAGFYDKLRVEVYHSFAPPGGFGWGTPKWTGALKDLYIDSPTYAISASLGVNITHVYQLKFKVDESAGNVFQGASATFDLVFDATQVTNPGWAE